MSRHNLTPDYQKLSELYGTFLGALGGVSITVLSIVMAFEIEGIREELRPYLIAALGAATFSCFTGGHLLTETAAFVSKSRETPWRKRTGARLCSIATINIYISVVLLIFSLVLLVVGLHKEVRPAAGAAKSAAEAAKTAVGFYVGLKWFFILIFTFVIISALIWMFLTLRYRLIPTKDDDWVSPLVVAGAVVSVWIICLLVFKYVFWMSLGLAVISTFFSLIHFTTTFKYGDQVRICDVYIFTLSIIIPCLSIAAACVKLLFFCEGMACR